MSSIIWLRMHVRAGRWQGTCHVISPFSHLRLTDIISSPREEVPVWLNDHDLASCIVYLAGDADLSQASNRVRADSHTCARIDRWLSAVPENGLGPTCCICMQNLPDEEKERQAYSLPRSADAIVYHMWAK